MFVTVEAYPVIKTLHVRPNGAHIIGNSSIVIATKAAPEKQVVTGCSKFLVMDGASEQLGLNIVSLFVFYSCIELIFYPMR